MSALLSQAEIVEITSRKKPTAQKRALEHLGFVVIGVNPRGELQCLANHPMDPAVKAGKVRGDVVRLNL